MRQTSQAQAPGRPPAVHAIGTLNLKQWIDEHRHLLRPPVGNAIVWKDAETIVMVIGGPNRRNDFHIDPGEEFFYQLEGEMNLRVMENGKPRDIPIRAGEILLLPPFVPHSPRRPAGTVGLVIERVRRAEERDRLQWYCEKCNQLLHEFEFHAKDLATELSPMIESFYGDRKLRTCGACGSVLEPPPATGA
jgi:3-hydroxyanthranilate 3,4-dioxygenase